MSSSIHGRIHRCVCGLPWWDSDGGPCHERCIDCGVVDEQMDDEGRCEKCHHIKCPECGRIFAMKDLLSGDLNEKNELKGGKCPTCWDFEGVPENEKVQHESVHQ